MGYTMDALIKDCRATLKDGESDAALETVRGHVERALKDETFLKDHLRHREAPPDRTVLYEDAALGFCICVHIHEGAKLGDPHDHGPTWAIYGQAEGETEMIDWRIVTPAADGSPARVEEIKRSTLVPGDARVYPIGAIHAPMRHGPTKLLRIEGHNIDRVRRIPPAKA